MRYLLLLSHFSRVWLCATPQTAAHQTPPSLGFSRQEHWSGLPFPSPMHESEKWKWSRSVVSDPMDCSLPGSSIHGIFQARVLEWVGCHCLLHTRYLGWSKPPWDRKIMVIGCQGLGWGETGKLLLNRYKVLILQNEKSCGDGQWWWLPNNVYILNTTELYT